MERVAVVDYHAYLATEPADLEPADRLVLPGVGAFDVAMAHLRDAGLADALTKLVCDEGVPFLGVCLGMQLVARHGDEGRGADGLGWIDASVERIVPGDDERVPHVGWNEVDPVRASPLFEGVPPASDFYFVHSFHVRCADEADVAATTPFAGGIVSAVARPPVYGVQFHPEKSQRHGLALLRNFLSVGA
jgi:glutamine amidotransferase